ncbi:MAG: OsmC family protein [Deltaproteobacteria bacterium]|nr:OsmC family protein [Deltaproteobacteria bacterium]
MKTISIEAKANDKYQVAVQAGERTLYVDQAVAVGGEGAGANPMEYLFASLAGCLATTARIIATQQNLDLKGMDIKVEGALDLNFLYGKSPLSAISTISPVRESWPHILKRGEIERVKQAVKDLHGK